VVEVIGNMTAHNHSTETRTEEMRSRKFKNQDPEPHRHLRNWIFSFLVSGMRKKPGIQRRVHLLAERAEWIAWVETSFGPVNYYWSREKLWNQIHKLIRVQQNPRTVLEFGVAWGYATNYWLSKNGSGIQLWHGFDRFTGLPRSWRDLDAGAFDAEGSPPKIIDPRVVWHIGDVEEQLPLLTIDNNSKLILFDLDLFEPTEFAWLHLRKSLNRGDIVYFDEGFDIDERKVIEDYVLQDFQVTVIGITNTAIAFMLNERAH